MRYRGEDFLSWIEKIRIQETDRAIAKIAKGENTTEILEELSHRIINKIMHPIYVEIKIDKN